MGDDNNNEYLRYQQQQQEFEDDLQIVIEKLIHALAIVLRRKIHKWIHKKDGETEIIKEVDKLEEKKEQETLKLDDYSE